MSESGLPRLDDVALLLHEKVCGCGAVGSLAYNPAAAAVMDLFEAAVPRIKAEALREAADAGSFHFAVTHRSVRDRGRKLVDPQWLRGEADRIESEAGKQ